MDFSPSRTREGVSKRKEVKSAEGSRIVRGAKTKGRETVTAASEGTTRGTDKEDSSRVTTKKDFKNCYG